MQMLGAFAVFFLFIIWLARYHLISVLRGIAGSGKGMEDFHGLISPRISVFLLLSGMAGVWIWLSFFGMDFFSAGAFLAVCFMLQLVTARLVCQGGLPYFTFAVAPSDGFLALFGSQWLQSGTVFLGTVVQKITFVDVRESAAPTIFHAAKLSDGSRPRRLFVWGVWLAILAGVLVSFISMLVLYYKFGINSLPDSWAVESTRKVHENAAFLLKHAEGAEQVGCHFLNSRGCVYDPPGSRLPDVYLVAAPSNRISDCLQFRHADPVVRFFRWMVLQRSRPAIRRSELLPRSEESFYRAGYGGYADGPRLAGGGYFYPL